MTNAKSDPGSFRDPSGRVYLFGDKVYRTVNSSAVDDFDFVESTGLTDDLVSRGFLLKSLKVPKSVLGTAASDAHYVIEHPRLPFISYPYEWPFSTLKAAALLHLNIQLEALKCGVTLSDASAFNIQFIGSTPIFIDWLSFVRYREGQFWNAHRQFCEHFLNPLLLRSLFGVAHNAWYRGTLEGIPTGDLRRLLRLRHIFSWNVLTHVFLQSIFQEKGSGNTLGANMLERGGLSRANFQVLLRRLKDWVGKLEPADAGKTLWQDYARRNSYAPNEAAAKRGFVTEFVAKTMPRMIWDLGCNTGDYTIAALEAGAKYAVGFDSDQGALEIGIARAVDMKLPLQFLFLDVANPTSCQGWAEQERLGLKGRASADATLALALIHHIVIARNIPMEQFVDWLTGLAPTGVVEFVPKSDEMVQQLLRFRTDIFSGYTEENFLKIIGARTRIVKTKRVAEGGRLLVWFDARDRTAAP